MSIKKTLGSAFLLAGVVVGLSACQSTDGPDVTAKKLGGIWQCKTVTVGIESIDQFEFFPETSEFQSVGNISFQLQNGNFLVFSRVIAGTWQVGSNTITQNIYGSRGNPNSPELREEMSKDKKVAEALAPVMNLVNQGPKQNDALYQIDQLTADNLNMHFSEQGQTIPVQCERVAPGQVAAPLGEQPAKIIAIFKQQAQVAQ